MIGRCALLFPFDTGLELDLGGETSRLILESSPPDISLEGQVFGGGKIKGWLYRFGVGLIQVSFPAGSSPEEWAKIACSADNVHVGRPDIAAYCNALAASMIRDAEKYAIHHYTERYAQTEIFPAFTIEPGLSDVDVYIKKNFKLLYSIVSGEPDAGRISEFVISKDPLANLGYYDDEIIMAKRFGAFIASRESEAVLDILRLAFAQYWSLRAYNFLMDEELDDAQELLDRVPPYWRVLKTFLQHVALSKGSLDFDKDKLEMILSINSYFPKVESDWHLRTLYKHISEAFNSQELYRHVDAKITRVEDSYQNARQFLSANFFIFLDALIIVLIAVEIVFYFFPPPAGHG